MIQCWIITQVISTECSQVIIISFIGHTSCSACLSSSMRPIFSWALLRSGFFSLQLIMLKIIPHTTNWVSLHHAHVSHRLSAPFYETFIPHVNGFTINKRSLVPLPPHFLFYITYYGPLWGVTSGFPATQWRLDERLPCDSRKTLKFTSHVSFLDWWRFFSVRSFLFSA